MDYKGFKNELSNYYRHLKNVERIREEIKDIWYQMSGVKGVRYDKEPSGFNPNLSEEKREYYSQLLDEKNIELDYTLASIRYIEMNLRKLSEEDKDICLKVVAEGISYEKVAMEKGYSKGGMWKRIKRELERIL